MCAPCYTVMSEMTALFRQFQIVVITLLEGPGFPLFLYWCIISLYPSLTYVNKTKVLM